MKKKTFRSKDDKNIS